MEIAQNICEQAKKKSDRSQTLKEQGILASQDWDLADKDIQDAQIRLNLATERLALVEKGRVKTARMDVESIIRAPITGTVLELLVNEGDPVVPLTSYQAGTALTNLADMTTLVFKGTVDEIDVGKLHEGMPARIKVGALPDAKVDGKVYKIAPKSKTAEGATLFDVEIELLPAPGVVLRAGYSANADIVVREKQDVLLIPERLVTFADGKSTVELPGVGDAEPVKREIKIGLSDGINVEVTDGPEGERARRRAAAQEDRVAAASRMTYLSFLRQMLQDVRHQKLRTLLTLLGITWGTVSVSLLVSFGEALQKRIVKNQRGLGENIVIAWPSRTSLPFEGLGKGRRIRVNEEDIEAPAARDPRGDVLGEYETDKKAFRRERVRLTPQISANSPIFAVMRNIIPAAGGRYVNDLDVDRRRRVVFLGDKLKKDLFGEPGRRGQDGDDRQRAVPGDRGDGEEGPGLELQRARQGQGLHPRHDVPGPLQRALRRQLHLPGAGRVAGPRRDAAGLRGARPASTSSTRRTRKRSGCGTRPSPRSSSRSSSACSAPSSRSSAPSR